MRVVWVTGDLNQSPAFLNRLWTQHSALKSRCGGARCRADGRYFPVSLAWCPPLSRPHPGVVATTLSSLPLSTYTASPPSWPRAMNARADSWVGWRDACAMRPDASPGTFMNKNDRFPAQLGHSLL